MPLADDFPGTFPQHAPDILEWVARLSMCPKVLAHKPSSTGLLSSYMAVVSQASACLASLSRMRRFMMLRQKGRRLKTTCPRGAHLLGGKKCKFHLECQRWSSGSQLILALG